MELIDKAAVVAEIERRKKIVEKRLYINNSYSEEGNAAWERDKVLYDVYNSLLSFLDTLEVKEVDLEESARHYLLHEHISPLNEVLHQADLRVEMQYHKDIEDAYKAGFELGLKVKKGE